MKTQPAKVSIVIPLYNRKDLIGYTLNSLSKNYHQGSEFEIIVVNDGSTDGGDIYVQQSFPEVKLIHQKNQGATIARNTGLRAATGKYVLYLDSDDLIERDFFQKKINALENNSMLAGVYGLWEHFDSKAEFHPSQIIPRHKAYPLEDIPCWKPIMERLLEGWYLPSHAVLWRKEVLDAVNGHDPELPINQDVDLLFRILLEERLLQGVDSPKALIREHSGEGRIGSTGTSLKKINSIYELRKNFVRKLEEKALLSMSFKKSLAEYCFHSWRTYRKQTPEIAEKFYQLSRQLDPYFMPKSGGSFKLLRKLLGLRQAEIVKDTLQNLVRK